MSLATFFMWILAIVGISNGPCAPAALLVVGVDAGQCSGRGPSAAYAKPNESAASATSPGPSLSVVEGGPVDDISNGF